jgi:hypothetical protein
MRPPPSCFSPLSGSSGVPPPPLCHLLLGHGSSSSSRYYYRRSLMTGRHRALGAAWQRRMATWRTMPWALESRHDPSMRRSSGEGWRPRCGRVGTAKYPVSGGGYFLGKMRRHGEVRRGGSQKLQGEQAGKVTKERGELRAGGLVCCGQAGHKQDGRSREKAGLTLLVANVLVCEERGKRGCEMQLGSFPFSVTSAYFCGEAG